MIQQRGNFDWMLKELHDGVPGVDERDLVGRVQATGEAIWSAFADYRWDGTPLDRFAEPCFPAA